MRKKNLIFVPVFLIILIQFFDKNDKYLWLQITILTILIIITLFDMVKKKK
jgi:hypothetical protein